MIKLRAGRLALCISALLALLALSAGAAGAATPGSTTPGAADNDTPSFGGPTTPELQNKVTFIGDSVTAGFGFCGYSENKKNTTKCKPNQEMANSWKLGDNSLSDCAPEDEVLADDACSNNNDNGKPWLHAAWEPGPNAPTVAYPFQIAARQKGAEKAEVSDWAMTGSTPKDWDPEGGEFGKQVDRLQNQYVGMTLGANPLLSYFTKIRINIPGYNVEGKCVDSTYKVESQWSWLRLQSVPSIYAGPVSNAVDCLKQKWDEEKQTQHLVNLYTTLLQQNDKVVVMGYYRDCSWSFGNWQPNANPFKGPASGNDCKGEKREISKNDSKEISQWDQATAVGSELNNLIHDAVDKAKDQAKQRWGADVADNLVYTQPNEAEWEKHQPTSSDSWIFKNDTWIHPSKAGDGNLADTMTAAMCQHFDRWCGSGETWASSHSIRTVLIALPLACSRSAPGASSIGRRPS